MSLTLESRIQRLNEMMEEGRLIRDDWSGTDSNGREVACLLAALSPEAGEDENPGACPAEVMPAWLAHITPWLDDSGSYTEWPRMIRRYAACANRWHTLDDSAWRRIEVAARRAAVVEVMRHTSDAMALDACRRVLAWLDADMPEEVRVTIEKEAVGMAYVAGAASRVAASRAAGAAWEAGEAAADRITDEILSALEKECGLGAWG